MADDRLLTVRDLRVLFGSPNSAVHAVAGVSIYLNRGETLGIVGESGCGKSSLALALLRLLPRAGRIVSGSIVFDGVDITRANAATLRGIRGMRVGMVFQNPMSGLNPVLTVGEQIAETLRAHTNLRGSALRDRCVELLHTVGLPNPGQQLGAYPHQFSGGMQQRVMIASAISCEPKLLIADEPTTALDVTIQAQILELLATLRDNLNMALLLVSHDMGVVATLADRVNVMYAGHIVEAAPVADVLLNPQHPYAMALMESMPRLDEPPPDRLRAIRGSAPTLLAPATSCPFHPRCPYAFDRCRAENPKLEAISAGHLAACWAAPIHARPSLGDTSSVSVLAAVGPVPPTGRASSMRAIEREAADSPSTEAPKTLVAIENLRVLFPRHGGLRNPRTGWTRAVDGVSLSIESRETLGLVGESGSGKSTMGRSILMLQRPSGGTVRFRGLDIGRLRPKELRRLRREMQIVLQDPYSSLDPRQRIGDALQEPLTIHGLATGSTAHDRVIELLEAVGLPGDAVTRFPHEFSGGQKQRIAIARVLAVNPSFVVCDEPTSALDVSVQAQIINLLQDLQDRFGLTYLFISHNLAVVRQVSSRIAVMYRGKVMEITERDELFSRPLHPYTQALLSAIPSAVPRTRTGIPRSEIKGELADTSSSPAGCVFHPRCPFARDRCRVEEPNLRDAGHGHMAACHYWEDIEIGISR